VKFTLAFAVYNKEKWIKSFLNSWLSTVSYKNEYEVVIVFDNLKDHSDKIAKYYLDYTDFNYQFLYADNKYEIFCNNLALQHAKGDYIIFIQDDNWIYDKNWDILLQVTIEKILNIRAIGFLAGLELFPSGGYRRIEVNRPHKKEHFNKHKIGSYKLGIWQVDAINRPFAINRNLLNKLGGLSREFMPTCGDDLDLSIRLLQEGKTNIYIPFDLLNTSSSPMLKQERDRHYSRALGLYRKKYKSYLMNRKNKKIRLLFSLKEDLDNETLYWVK